VDPAKERRLIVLAFKRMGGPLTGFIASRLPLNVGVETFRVPGSEQAIATEILRVAASMGDVIEAEPPELSWVGRGVARNPAVVTVTPETDWLGGGRHGACGSRRGFAQAESR